MNFRETTTVDSDIPSPVEERRTHDSGWEDDLHDPVRSPDHRLIVSAYLVGRGVEVSVDHGRIHLPLLKVSGFSEFLPGLNLVVDTRGKQQGVREYMGLCNQIRDPRSVQHVLKELVILDLQQRVVPRNRSGTGGVWAQRIPNLDSNVVRLISRGVGIRTNTTVWEGGTLPSSWQP